MIIRSCLYVTLLLAGGAAAAQQLPRLESRLNAMAGPVLRASVTVATDLVRIGDVIDNAGPASEIAIYRSPDLGTTGSLSTSTVLAALRAHQVIGVETGNLREISVTRLARTLEAQEIEQTVLKALELRNGLGDAGNLALKFDRELQTLQFDPASSGALRPTAVNYNPRGGRFDIVFEIAGDTGAPPTRLRFSGTVTETAEAAVLVRSVERNEILKASDVVVERRPKAEIGGEPAGREAVIGMQARRPLRAGQPLRGIDLNKPDLVTRDQSVTLIYDSPGLYLTVRGKALEAGTEGDVVNVLNLQSKRTIAGTVVGRGQVAIMVAAPRVVASATAAADAAVPSPAPSAKSE